MLEGKVVLITGAGSGLGRALAVAFIEQGCFVTGIVRRGDSLNELTGLIPSERFLALTADVARFDQVKAAVESTVSLRGRIDILFNNAAAYPKVSFLDETPEQWSRAIDVNVNGVANCCKAVLPCMIEARYGRIYNVGSFADGSPIPNSAAYSASKGAVRALTKAVAADIQHLNLDIEVHEWIPGHLKTRMSDFTGFDPSISAGWAVRMASVSHARKKNCIFENDREWLPPKGLRRRLEEKLLFWREYD